MTEITKLPDGSAFYTAEILDREEAMALPLHKRPLNYRLKGDAYHAIFETVGQAWALEHNPESPANFAEAEELTMKLCFRMADIYPIYQGKEWIAYLAKDVFAWGTNKTPTDEQLKQIERIIIKHAPRQGWRPIEDKDKDGELKFTNMGYDPINHPYEFRKAKWCPKTEIHKHEYWWIPGTVYSWCIDNQPTLIFDVPEPPTE